MFKKTEHVKKKRVTTCWASGSHKKKGMEFMSFHLRESTTSPPHVDYQHEKFCIFGFLDFQIDIHQHVFHLLLNKGKEKEEETIASSISLSQRMKCRKIQLFSFTFFISFEILSLICASILSATVSVINWSKRRKRLLPIASIRSESCRKAHQDKPY